MTKLLLFCLLTNAEFVFPAGTSLKQAKTHNIDEHFEKGKHDSHYIDEHFEKGRHDSLLKQGPLANKFLYRNIPQRCSIICPITFPDICGYPAAPQITPLQTSQPSTSQTDTNSVPQTNTSNQNQNPVKNFIKGVTNFPQLFGTAPQKILGRNIRKHRNYNIYIPLTKHQKRVLLKHTNLRRSYGKNIQKLRQVSVNNCQVVCTEIIVETAPNLPQSYYNEGGKSGSDQSQEKSDEDSGDNYEEGEDTPIEITQKPVLPHNEVIESIRPIIGNVNFFGWDDFGPNGEPAGYPQLIEEKNQQKQKERLGKRKHS